MGMAKTVIQGVECKFCGGFYRDVTFLKNHIAKKHQCDKCDFSALSFYLAKHKKEKHAQVQECDEENRIKSINAKPLNESSCFIENVEENSRIEAFQSETSVSTEAQEETEELIDQAWMKTKQSSENAKHKIAPRNSILGTTSQVDMTAKSDAVTKEKSASQSSQLLENDKDIDNFFEKHWTEPAPALIEDSDEDNLNEISVTEATKEIAMKILNQNPLQKMSHPKGIENQLLEEFDYKFSNTSHFNTTKAIALPFSSAEKTNDSGHTSRVEKTFPIDFKVTAGNGKLERFNMEYRVQLNKNTGEKIYKCKVCNHETKYKYTLKQHLKINHSCKKCSTIQEHLIKCEGLEWKSFNCKKCSFTFETKTLLDKHVLDFHADVKCKFCSKIFRGDSYRKTHMASKHMSKFKRDLSKYQIDSLYPSQQSTKVIEVVQSKKIRYSCLQCDFRSSSIEELQLHYLEDH